MPIYQAGALNTTALTVPNLYVEIEPPNVVELNGVPTNDLGVVGTATWGPVNKPVNLGSLAGYNTAFGPVMNRTYDMGTQVAIAYQQGAQNFTCVRVTDGSDAKATVEIETTCLALTALYSGTYGNQITATISAGGLPNTYNIAINSPNLSELFKNITGTGNAFWLAAAAAINSGQGVSRGPSQLVSAVAGAGTTAPAAATLALTGGTDGATTITTSVLVGTDTSPAAGMYALRNQGCSVLLLADSTDTTQWSVIAAFGLSEGIYVVAPFAAATGLPASSISTNVTALQTAGISTYAFKAMMGDWVYWFDQTNNITRLVSPAAFVAGLLANLSPQNSTCNKPLVGVIGTQQSGPPGTNQAQTYSSANLQAMETAGIEVITNPIPAGFQWGVRFGINTSQVQGTTDDSYTRMTNYLASTLNAGMGIFIGQLINPGLLSSISTTLISFLNGLLQNGVLGTVYNSAGQPSVPFGVQCNAANNPQTQLALGNVTALVQVTYQAINKYFVVALQGGSTVSVTVL